MRLMRVASPDTETLSMNLNHHEQVFVLDEAEDMFVSDAPAIELVVDTKDNTPEPLVPRT